MKAALVVEIWLELRSFSLTVSLTNKLTNLPYTEITNGPFQFHRIFGFLILKNYWKYIFYTFK